MTSYSLGHFDAIQYDSWDELVAAEASGYVVVAVIDNGKQTWPWVVGPYVRKHEANLARARLRRRLKKETDWRPAFTFRLFIRPAWKEVTP